MFQLILCGIIVVIFYISTLNLYAKCDSNPTVYIDRIIGTKITMPTGIGMGTGITPNSYSGMGIQIKFPNVLACGVYQANTQYGPVSIIIGKKYKNQGTIFFPNITKEIQSQTSFNIWSMSKIINSNDIIKVYNNGCC